MANPIICEVTRGDRVESIHRGSYAVVDADGALIASAGDIAPPVFARSALKLMQALPLIESGAADHAGLSVQALALACASHSGEPGHIATARGMLAAAGVPEEALGCGPHWPREIAVAAALARSEGRPGRIHNNCSGKHAGFLCTAHHLGQDLPGYLDPQHPLQRDIRAIIEALSDATLAGDVCSIDGCSAPTYGLPLHNFAAAFARLATGNGLAVTRAAAARRLMAAAMAEPWHVAGTGRMCTDIMRLGAGRIYAKTGAEGVYVAAFPDDGIALALKCDDGAGRAADVLLAALALRHMAGAPAAVGETLAAMAELPVSDYNGVVVGRVRAVV